MDSEFGINSVEVAKLIFPSSTLSFFGIENTYYSLYDHNLIAGINSVVLSITLFFLGRKKLSALIASSLASGVVGITLFFSSHFLAWIIFSAISSILIGKYTASLCIAGWAMVAMVYFFMIFLAEIGIIETIDTVNIVTSVLVSLGFVFSEILLKVANENEGKFL